MLSQITEASANKSFIYKNRWWHEHRWHLLFEKCKIQIQNINSHIHVNHNTTGAEKITWDASSHDKQYIMTNIMQIERRVKSEMQF